MAVLKQKQRFDSIPAQILLFPLSRNSSVFGTLQKPHFQAPYPGGFSEHFPSPFARKSLTHKDLQRKNIDHEYYEQPRVAFTTPFCSTPVPG